MTKATTSTSTKATKAVKTKAATKVEAAPVLETQPSQATAETANATETQATPQVEEASVSLRPRFDALIKSKQEQIAALKAEVAELRKMQRDHESALKEASKKSKKKRRDDGVPRKPSGFASPVVVSDELYKFLAKYGVKSGEPIARTDVTRHITAYIKEHDLQNPEHRREILPDATLKKLFGPAIEPKDPSDPSSPKVYSYLRLQKYISQHFPKSQK